MGYPSYDFVLLQNDLERARSVCERYLNRRTGKRGYMANSHSMSKTYGPYSPDHLFLLPLSLKGWLPEEHQAYFVIDLVDQLDLSAIDPSVADAVLDRLVHSSHRIRLKGEPMRKVEQRPQ